MKEGRPGILDLLQETAEGPSIPDAAPADIWDDLTLVRRCARRDTAAWGVFLDREGPFVLAVLRRAFRRAGVGSPAQEAEEALGDLVLALLDRDGALLDAYRPSSPLRVYLAVIARTTASRRLRKRHPLLGLNLDALPSPVSIPEPLIGGAEVDPVRVRKAMASLAPKARLLLRLLYWHGWSYAQAARSLGLPAANLGTLATRAREAFRKALARQS